MIFAILSICKLLASHFIPFQNFVCKHVNILQAYKCCCCCFFFCHFLHFSIPYLCVSVFTEVSFMQLRLLTIFSKGSIFCHPLDLFNFSLGQLLICACWQPPCLLHLGLGHLNVCPHCDGCLLWSWKHTDAKTDFVKSQFLNTIVRRWCKCLSLT